MFDQSSKFLNLRFLAINSGLVFISLLTWQLLKMVKLQNVISELQFEVRVDVRWQKFYQVKIFSIILAFDHPRKYNYDNQISEVHDNARPLTKPMEEHESYLVCPGKHPVKIESHNPVSIHIYFHNLLNHPTSHHINSHHASNIDKPNKNINANDKLSKDNNDSSGENNLDENEPKALQINKDNEQHYPNGTHFIEIYHWILHYD